jgi:glycosyltransferase involved in cell wall biosynthesis
LLEAFEFCATMNIGVNFYMGGPERGGIDWSISHLLPPLLQAGARHSFTLLTNLPRKDVFAEFHHPPNLKVVSFQMPNYTMWEQVGLPLLLARDRPSLFHSPFGLPIVCPSPGIATIHDLCFITHPETFTHRMRTYFRLFIPRSARRARIVLTVSETSRRRLVELFGIPETKVRVVPNGIAADFHPIRDPRRLADVRKAHGLPERFILYVGTREPRKNVVTLLRACQRLWARGCVEKLVLVGRRGWLSEPIEEFVRRAGLDDRVVFAGYLPRRDLPAVYSAATLFVFPSICEGFGLPPVEAMACGTPVVASNASALPEVLGTAARLVNPLDPAGLALAIEEVLDDERLRERLRADGFERATMYRWDAAARRVLQIYEEVCGNGG